MACINDARRVAPERSERAVKDRLARSSDSDITHGIRMHHEQARHYYMEDRTRSAYLRRWYRILIQEAKKRGLDHPADLPWKKVLGT